MGPRLGETRLVPAIRFSHQALGSIPRHRAAHAPSSHKTRLALEIEGSENEQHEQRCAVGFALFIDALVFGSMTDAFRRGESLVGAVSNPVTGHETLGR